MKKYESEREDIIHPPRSSVVCRLRMGSLLALVSLGRMGGSVVRRSEVSAWSGC